MATEGILATIPIMDAAVIAADALTILVADDNRLTVKLLDQLGQRLGHRVFTAYDGDEAAAILASEHIDILITDLSMPGRDGLDLVRSVRAQQDDRYTYVIMITQHREDEHLSKGRAAGVDDFLVKPIDFAELNARLSVAERIITMTHALSAQKREIEQMNRRMREELQAAAQVQQSLLPKELPDIPGWRFAWRVSPCEELAGDSVGILHLDEHHVACYVFDVTGHGVTAALLSTQVSRYLHAAALRASLGTGSGSLTDPAALMRELNGQFPLRANAPQMIAISYIIIDTRDGSATWTSAGNPAPFLIDADGARAREPRVHLFVGARPECDCFNRDIQFEPNTRCYLMSDGISETWHNDHGAFGDDRITDHLDANRTEALDASIDSLITATDRYSSSHIPADDRAVLAIQRLVD